MLTTHINITKHFALISIGKKDIFLPSHYQILSLTGKYTATSQSCPQGTRKGKLFCFSGTSPEMFNYLSLKSVLLGTESHLFQGRRCLPYLPLGFCPLDPFLLLFPRPQNYLCLLLGSWLCPYPFFPVLRPAISPGQCSALFLPPSYCQIRPYPPYVGLGASLMVFGPPCCLGSQSPQEGNPS